MIFKNRRRNRLKGHIEKAINKHIHSYHESRDQILRGKHVVLQMVLQQHMLAWLFHFLHFIKEYDNNNKIIICVLVG